MSRYYPSDDTNGERFLLIQLDPVQYGGDHRHISGAVVREAVRDHVDPDSETGRVIYADGKDAKGYRWADWSSGKDNALFVDDFKIHSQMTVKNYDGQPGDREIYGMDVEFKPYNVKAREARLMVKTFDKVEKTITRLNNEFGYPEKGDFAAYAIRVAKALGIKRFLVYRGYTPTGSLEDASNFRVVEPSSLKYHIEAMLDAVYGKEGATA